MVVSWIVGLSSKVRDNDSRIGFSSSEMGDGGSHLQPRQALVMIYHANRHSVRSPCPVDDIYTSKTVSAPVRNAHNPFGGCHTTGSNAMGGGSGGESCKGQPSPFAPSPIRPVDTLAFASGTADAGLSVLCRKAWWFWIHTLRPRLGPRARWQHPSKVRVASPHWRILGMLAG